MNYFIYTSHLDSEDELVQSDGKSVNRGLPVLDLPILLASAGNHPRRTRGS